MSKKARPSRDRAGITVLANLAVAAAFLAATLAAQAQATRDRPEKSEPAASSAPRAGQGSPQGQTGPIDTGSGGAPAASPQGETPPGMQSNPSSTTGASQPPAKGQ
jgi:hypothetical protein